MSRYHGVDHSNPKIFRGVFQFPDATQTIRYQDATQMKGLTGQMPSPVGLLLKAIRVALMVLYLEDLPSMEIAVPQDQGALHRQGNLQVVFATIVTVMTTATTTTNIGTVMIIVIVTTTETATTTEIAMAIGATGNPGKIESIASSNNINTSSRGMPRSTQSSRLHPPQIFARIPSKREAINSSLHGVM